ALSADCAESAFACVLGRVQRLVSPLEEARGTVVRLQLGHAGGHADATGPCDRLRRDGALNAADELASLSQLGFGNDHRELVASHTAGDVGRADYLAHTLRDLSESGIACEVAHAVIDLLEAVDVDEHECELPLISVSPVELAGEGLVEVPAVVEAGERVEVSELPRLAEPARILDRRCDPLGQVFEPLQVLVAEASAGIAREDSEPADATVAADERHAERAMHRAGCVLGCIEALEPDRAS